MSRTSISVKTKMQAILIVLVFLFVLIAYFGYSGIFTFRLMFIFIGPMISAIFFITFILYFTYDDIKTDNSFKEILSFSIVGGVVSIITALTLNTRSFLTTIIVLQSVFSIKNEGIIALISIGLIGPIIEEFSKTIHIYILSTGVYTSWGKKETRILNNKGTILMISMLAGVIFTLLETYWYIFNLGYIYDVSNTNIWNLLAGQVIIRSIFPIHIATTAMMGYGLLLTLYNKPSINVTYKDYSLYTMGIILAITLHGLWNGLLILSEMFEFKTITISSYQIPIVNLFIGLIALGVVIIVPYYIKKLSPSVCEHCSLWHIPLSNIEDHNLRRAYTTSTFQLQAVSKYLKKCHNCKSEVSKDICERCKAVLVHTCGNCKNYLPIYIDVCWNCNFAVNPPYNKFLEYRSGMLSNLAIGITRILTTLYIPISLSLLIMAVMGNTEDEILIRFFLLILLSSCYLITSIWLSNEKTRSMGISLSRIFLAIILFQFGLLLSIFGALFVNDIRFILVSLAYWIEAIVLFYIGMKSLVGYRPVIHGGKI